MNESGSHVSYSCLKNINKCWLFCQLVIYLLGIYTTEKPFYSDTLYRNNLHIVIKKNDPIWASYE